MSVRFRNVNKLATTPTTTLLACASLASPSANWCLISYLFNISSVAELNCLFVSVNGGSERCQRMRRRLQRGGIRIFDGYVPKGESLRMRVMVTRKQLD